MAMKKGLGKGLDALIPAGETNAKNGKETPIDSPDKMVNISKVEPNPDQPRKSFAEDELEELADSIKKIGIFQPILVQDKGDHYMIVAGERRWRAALKAGLKEVPVIIKNYTEEEIVIISLLENIQRVDLNPIEEAQTYKKLIDTYKYKQDEVAEKVSKSRTAVTNSMRLLKLADEVQQLLIENLISSGHARALLAVDDKATQYELAQRVMDEKLSVREIEKIIKDLNKPKKEEAKKQKKLNFLYKDLEEKIKRNLGTKVTINAKDEKKGKIEIEYFSKEELERITDILSNN
ncbi:MAG: ParB/RepB/Spo0J family partition protein [Lachnospiraceae bacterium]|nr:ParB/RepB/Spo0J family partition protein [Lachnospiraceae bacterium]